MHIISLVFKKIWILYVDYDLHAVLNLHKNSTISWLKYHHPRSMSPKTECKDLEEPSATIFHRNINWIKKFLSKYKCKRFILIAYNALIYHKWVVII